VRVQEAGTGATVKGALVFMAEHRGEVVPRAHAVETDEQGECELSRKTGASMVCASARGFAASCVAISGDQETCTLLMEQGYTIEGGVVDQAGRPVAGARVVAVLPRSEKLWPIAKEWLLACGSAAEAQCDSEGRFELTGLEETPTYELYASAAGFARDSREPPVVARSGQRGTEVQLVSCSRLLVRWRDARTHAVLDGVWSTATTGVSTTMVSSVVDDAPGAAAENELAWRGAVARMTLAAQPGSDASAGLQATLRCGRLGYLPREVSLSAVLGEDRDVVLDLEPTPALAWSATKLRAEYRHGRAFTGTLWVTLRQGTETLDRRFEFIDGGSLDAINLPAGAYEITARGTRDPSLPWSRVGVAVAWQAQEGAPAPLLVLEGHPVRLRVFGPGGERVRVYRVAGRRAGQSMFSWTRVWRLDALSRERPAEADEPLFVPAGTTELIFEDARLARGRLTLRGSGDGEPLQHDVHLLAGGR
jgi:hypothetical protein